MSKENFIEKKDKIFNINEKLVKRKKKIGEGAFSLVYLCKYNYKNYVMKTMINTKDVDKFLYREGVICNELRHKNIVKFVGIIKEKDALIFEYIDGMDLFLLLKRKGKFYNFEVINYVTQLCKGVRYIHKNGIIHRDIKIENIMVGKRNNIKLIDFGLSIFEDEISDSKTLVGSIPYLAPEVIEGPKYSKKVDVYAIGVILYELLDGFSPFLSDNEYDLLKEITNFSGEFDKEIFCELSKDLILKLIAIKPEDRMNVNEILKHPYISKNLIEKYKNLYL